jgi:archaeosortase A (PGF-CTERM-specific)
MSSPPDALAVVVVAAFAGGAVLEAAGRRQAARFGLAAAWLLFAAFWAVLTPFFLFEQGSFIEGALSAAAVPGSAYVALLLYRGRETLVTLSRAVAVMGVVYMPVQLSDALARPLIAVTVEQVAFVVDALGYEYTMRPGPEIGTELGLANGFLMTTGGSGYLTEVVLACTGLGSIAIFAGLVAAVDAPRRRKATALAVVVPLIYVLNVARVTFIALAHGRQWFRYEPAAGVVSWLMGVPRAEAIERTSWFLADRVLAQSMSVLALVVIALVVVRVLPELVVVFEEVLYVATGNDYDLSGAVGAGPAAAGGQHGDGPEDD